MTNGIGDAKSIREVHLFRQGSEVSPAEVFNHVYSTLDELVDHNQKVFRSKSQAQNLSMGSQNMGNDAELERLSLAAAKGIEAVKDARGLVAVVRFDDGRTERLQVSPRTNYNRTLLKRPNIVHLLSGSDAPGFVLRESRVYDPKTDEIISKLARRQVHENYKGSFTQSSLADSHHSTKPADTYLVPEPNLVLALEQATSEGVSQRIVPESKVVGVDNKNLWHVRNFLPAVRDASIDPRSILSYFATLHAQGLMDKVDAQLVHYCLANGKVVNIDPDFMLFSRSKPLVEHQGWGAVKSDNGWNESGIISRGYFNSPTGKEMYRQAFNEAGKLINPDRFAKYVPRDLRTAPALKALMVENPHIGG